MGAVEVSPSFPHAPAFIGLSNRTVATWLRALCWMSQHRSDLPPEWVPLTAMPLLGATPRVQAQLTAADAWAPRSVNGQNGYHVTGQGKWWRLGVQPGKAGRPAIPRHIRAAVLLRDGHRCVECLATDDLSLDHIYPHSLGGADTVDNLRVLCRPCNSRKGARV